MKELLTKQEFEEERTKPETITIDVRTPQEIEQGKLYKDAKELDINNPQALQQLQTLPKNKRYLLYCRSGGRTAQLTMIMKRLGYQKVGYLQGGILGTNTRL
jgi:rhodanese-related sulfurtransferase